MVKLVIIFFYFIIIIVLFYLFIYFYLEGLGKNSLESWLQSAKANTEEQSNIYSLDDGERANAGDIFIVFRNSLFLNFCLVNFTSKE